MLMERYLWTYHVPSFGRSASEDEDHIAASTAGELVRSRRSDLAPVNVGRGSADETCEQGNDGRGLHLGQIEET